MARRIGHIILCQIVPPGVVEIERLDERAIVCFPGGCQTTNLGGSNTMAEEKMALQDVLRKGEEPGGDVPVQDVTIQSIRRG